MRPSLLLAALAVACSPVPESAGTLVEGDAPDGVADATVSDFEASGAEFGVLVDPSSGEVTTLTRLDRAVNSGDFLQITDAACLDCGGANATCTGPAGFTRQVSLLLERASGSGAVDVAVSQTTNVGAVFATCDGGACPAYDVSTPDILQIDLLGVLNTCSAFAIYFDTDAADSITLSSSPPTVNGADIAMLQTSGEFDAGADNGHIWSDRPLQGQTFTTLGAGPYTLNAVTLRSRGPNIVNNSATFTVRIGTVTGTTFTEIARAETSQTLSYPPGRYITMHFGDPVTLDSNTVYGFDWDSSGSGFITDNNNDALYVGGSAFHHGAAGVGNDTNLVFTASDRLFHVDLD